jgi:hypothetical protein
MGQYFQIYNLDKKETLTAIASGVKLLEMSSDFWTMSALAVLLANSNGRGGGDLNVEVRYSKSTFKPNPTKAQAEALKTVELVAGRWAGDRIVFQGDYANEKDPAFISEDVLKNYTDITQLCVDALRAAGEPIDDEKGFQITKSFGRVV